VAAPIDFKTELDALIKGRDLYFVGSKLPNDWYEAYGSWLPLADEGDAKAQVNVGFCFQHGHGADKNIDQAIAYYMKAAEQKDPRACYCLYQFFEAKKDTSKAQEFLERAYEMKEGRAVFSKAKLLSEKALENGHRDEALKHWQQVIDSAAPPSQIEYAKAIIIGLSLQISSISVGKMQKLENITSTGTFRGTSQYSTTYEYSLPVKITYNNKTNYSCSSVSLVESGTDIYLAIENVEPGTHTYTYVISNAGLTRCAGKALTLDRVEAYQRTISTSVVESINERKQLGIPRIALSSPIQLSIPSTGGCFVLTACYGSADAPTVYAFRKFRDNHLTRYSLGRRFISWYYKHGPAWADRISTMPRTKLVLRRVFGMLAKLLPN